MDSAVDIVPGDAEVEAYASSAYKAFVDHRFHTQRIAEPRWEYLRHDLKSFWLGQARSALSVYAYASYSVSHDA